ncbi:hypothetical protein FB45DRAFT_452762 [Roridomyces roridus]|uniref:Uncharacterized protein n=1 Tax=Roridomyces roridus TaxID=1738132 RepID=A0AAD7C279_9AGAR|nr:hypothetical protein FB45DRAFT_452762 [Roridomyces roridus]
MVAADIPELVIREVTSSITTFSKPFARYGFVPFGGRTTAIRLSTGDVWVLASTPLTKDTKEAIDKMGPVKWIMAGDMVHYMYLAQFKEEYPEAKVIGVEKMKSEGVELAGAYGVDAPDTKYGFEDEIRAVYFSGFKNKDVAWFHVESKTLVVADLMFNLPANEQYSKSKSNPRLPIFGSLTPWGGIHKHFVWGLGEDKAAMKRDAQTVLEWGPERIIMCHGDVIETDGTKAWATAYSKYFSQ